MFGEESGHDSAEVIPDTDEGNECADAFFGVMLGLTDLTEIVDGSECAADAAGSGEEEEEHVEAEQSLKDCPIVSSWWGIEHIFPPLRFDGLLLLRFLFLW